jgi:hypothetical protein
MGSRLLQNEHRAGLLVKEKVGDRLAASKDGQSRLLVEDGELRLRGGERLATAQTLKGSETEKERASENDNAEK